mgnify:CR=1 FL=1
MNYGDPLGQTGGSFFILSMEKTHESCTNEGHDWFNTGLQP